MKSSVPLLLLFLGIVCITIGYSKLEKNCPRPKIEYRYVPQSIYAEQLDNPSLTDPYSNIGKMFSQDPVREV